MLKVTYTETGICLEYCPEPLDLLLSDRVCMYVHAQRPITIQPMQASLPLPTTLVGMQELDRFQELEVSLCDLDWLEVTFRGVWITENPDQEEGVFVTELQPHLEQRLLRLWMRSQTTFQATAIMHGTV
ncbi:MAG: alr0857 family protein [Cyanobacteria bacterium J06639_14]